MPRDGQLKVLNEITIIRMNCGFYFPWSPLKGPPADFWFGGLPGQKPWKVLPYSISN
jgi:hypothetical protein